jgi:hypothetical protein
MNDELATYNDAELKLFMNRAEGQMLTDLFLQRLNIL